MSTLVLAIKGILFTKEAATKVAQEALAASQAVYRARAVRTASKSQREAGEKEAAQHAVWLLGSLLYETKRNLERARWMYSKGVKGFAPMDFTITDALLPDLCRLAPSPGFLDQCQDVVSALKRIDFFIRTAAQASMDGPPLHKNALSQAAKNPSAQDRLYERVKAFVDDAFSKNIVERYNNLVAVAGEMSGLVFNDREATTINVIPGPTQPDAEIDHTLI